MEDLPRDLATERALLSSLLLDPRHYARLGPRIKPELFSHELHADLAAVMRRVRADGLDVTMLSVLTEIRRDEATAARFMDASEGMAVLASMSDAGIPSNAAETYLKLAEEFAAKRNVLRANDELAALAKNGASASDLARLFHAYSKRMETILNASEDIRTVDVLAALTAALPPVPWIADGWLGEGDLVIFGGEWATGKSLIALDLAISVSLGLKWMGRIPIAKTGPVLYVDEENNARNVTRRLARMIRGRNLEFGEADRMQLRYLSKNHLRLDSGPGLTTLRTEIEAHRPVLVILDSLIRFHGAEENSNSEMSALFGEAIVPLATKYGCAFVVLDHLRKPGQDDDKSDPGHRIRGAGDKAGVGDGVWTLMGDRETDTRTLSCRKNRWEDSLPPAITTKWKVSDDEAAAWIEASDATLSAEVAVQTALSASPSGLLASVLYERIERLGVSRATGKRTIARLKNAGSIEYRKEQGNRVRYWVGTLVSEGT